MQCKSVILSLLVLLGGFGQGFQWSANAQTNGVYRQVYNNISGSTIADLLTAPAYPNLPSASTILTNGFEAPVNAADNYGQRLRAFLIPPASGYYLFWIASDDQSVLSLSDDENPANKREIASVAGWTDLHEWNKEVSQISQPILLKAGSYYYIEAVMKEGYGGDNLSVRWQLPDGTIEEPIADSRLVPITVPINPPIITRQPANTVVHEGQMLVLGVDISNLDQVGYQWNRSGFPMVGATNAYFTNLAVSSSENGVRYSCVITNALGATNTDIALLTVIPDIVPPVPVSAYNIGDKKVVVVFSEPVYALEGAASFAIDNGISVLSLASSQDPRIVVLNTSPLKYRTSYAISFREIIDRAGASNPLPQNSRHLFTTLEFSPLDVGGAALAGSIEPVADGFRIVATGTDIGGAMDQFQFNYQERLGNFDFRLRIESMNEADLWAKVGLMVRENLAPSSRYAAVLTTPSIGGSFFQYRQTTGSLSVASGNFPVNYPQTWLRLKREGDLISGYASYDGDNWADLGSIKMVFTRAVYFGIAACSHYSNQVAQVEIRNFTQVSAPGSGVKMKPQYEPLAPCTRRTGLVISEIMYHPLPRNDGKNLEFIELFNASSIHVDLSGHKIAGAINFTFPDRSRLAPGGFLVVAAAPDDIRSVYGITNVVGGFPSRLSNFSEALQLRNREGAVLLDIQYSGEAPWPASADGAGHSLVLARPSFGEGSSRAWAASELVGGSPGRGEYFAPDPLRAVVINELVANSDAPSLDFIELYNHSNQAVDVSRCSLSDSASAAKFRIPDGTIISARGCLAFNEQQLGFALNSTGETVYFWNADGSKVLDSIRFGATASGSAIGRYPNGSEYITSLSMATPSALNQSPAQGSVVINEIMYHPISGNPDDEYVELHNLSTNAVTLDDWRFVDGIDFTFPSNSILSGKGYWVIARNAQQLLQTHPGLSPTNVLGNFSGALSNQGERIALAMSSIALTTNGNQTVTSNRVYIVVDAVQFDESGRWGQWADGGGSSLELKDPRSDNRLAANWADSDESGNGEWTTIENTGVLDLGIASYGLDSLQILLLGNGECLVDNVEVLDQNGNNILRNSTFEPGISGWYLRGNHKQSILQERGGVDGSQCLRIRATGRGDTGPNQVYAPLTMVLREKDMATIRARVKWLKGCPEILFRIRGNYLEATGRMMLSAAMGTPGGKNSRLISNCGPAIYDVSHAPVLPAANEAVRVTAKVADPDGLAGLWLNYRIDPAVSYQTVSMLDDGTGGDDISNDGVYTATIPGQATGTLVVFYLEARDKAVPAASATFPSDASQRSCLVRFGEFVPPGSFGAYRFWITQATHNEWSTREKGSNESLDATFVYGNSRVMYNIGALFSGSPFHWRGYDTPTGRNCNYVLNFPGDDRFLGVTDFVLNAPSNLGSDSTGQREQISHWMAGQLGLPETYRRFIHLFVNGVRRGNIFEDVQQPSREYVAQWYPEDASGDLYKIEDWFEYNNSFGFYNKDATLELFTTTGNQKKLAAYRWMWRKRAVEESANDYSLLFALVDAVNAQGTEAYNQAVTNLVDIRQWLRTMAIRHAVGDWDSYGYRRGKNMYAYKPKNGLWKLMNWDISFALGLGDGPTQDLFARTHSNGSVDPVTDAMFKHPPFRRLYYQAFLEIINGPMLNERVDPVMDDKYNALTANGISVTTPASVKAWIKNRRTYIQSIISTNRATFGVVSNQLATVRTNRNWFALEGSAPIEVDKIQVNGVTYPVNWSTPTQWVIYVPLRSGENQLFIQGFDLSGKPITNAVASVKAVFTGPVQLPQNHIVINEIMYHPTMPDAAFIEIFNTSASQVFDLSGVGLSGLDFEFPEGTVIAPQAYVLVVKNKSVFSSVYGDGLPVVGQYLGQMQNNGETLRLVKKGTNVDQEETWDRVTYDNRAPWPWESDGYGASLQLIDPFQENDRVGNWIAVGTNGLASPQWKFASATGIGTGSQLQISLSSDGEVLLDDIRLVEGVVPRQGVNLLQNGDFEAPLATGWKSTAGYALSGISAVQAYSGQNALRLVRQASTNDTIDYVTQDILPALNPGKYYSLSYWHLPGLSGGDLTVTLSGGGIRDQRLATPEPIAKTTPGKVNSIRATLPTFPSLWINEVQPVNTGHIKDSQGQNDPWIELYNGGVSSIDLSGYYLSANYTNLTEWLFPQGTVLSPGQFLIVWIDGQAEQTSPSELHASFRLSVSGAVVLARPNLNRPIIIDYFNYAGISPGLSAGCYPDANPQKRGVFALPTPGSANSLLPITVIINEWMAGNNAYLADPADGDFDDWFELYNPGAYAVDLSRYTLSDSLTNASQFVIPNGTIIPATGYLLVWADNEPQQNGPARDLHANFRLDREGDMIALYNPAGILIDAVSFGQQTNDVSQGRYPDGNLTATPVFMSAPTPNQVNSYFGSGQGKLLLLGITVNAAQVNISFQSEAGKIYQAQYRDAMDSNHWVNIEGVILATDSITTFIDSQRNNSHRFYRVIKVTP